MFEALLEKILLSHFGQYLSGLDRNNIHLGVWSGNLIIENVSLKSEAIDMWELPLQLRFSHIEKFQVNVPWSKLSQQSVEVIIENVFVIVTQKAKTDWRITNYKYELIERFLKKTIEEFIQNKTKFSVPVNNNPNIQSNIPTSVDKQGIFDRLITRVIDNIYITIQNIHIRYENDLEKPGFSWGITLSDLKILTTDSSYKNKIFHDRSNMIQKEQFIYKKAELMKLGFYWNSNDLQFIANLAPSDIKTKMYNFSLYAHKENNYSKRIDYIVSIDCEVKAIINTNPLNNVNQSIAINPELQILLNLKTLNFNIRNSQLQDFIRMMELFESYQSVFQREKAKNMKKIDAPSLKPLKDKKNEVEIQKTCVKLWKYLGSKLIKRKMKVDFEGLFLKLLRYKKNPIYTISDQKELNKVFDEKEMKYFPMIISSIEINELYLWIKELFIHEEQLKLIKKQKKLTTGLFCGTKNIKKQQLMLASIYEKAQDKVETLVTIDAPESYVLRSFRFELEEMNIRLTKKLKKFDEGLNFRLKSLQLNVNLKANSLDLSSEIKEIGVDLINNYEAKNEIIIPILKKNLEFHKKKHYFLTCHIKKQLNDLLFEMDLGSLEIIYYPSIMLKLMSYFSVQSTEEGVKNLAAENYEKIQQVTTQKLEGVFSANNVSNQSLEVVIRIKIASPTLIIPFLQYNDLQSPCFVVDLGDIELNNEDASENKSAEYQNFILRFNSIRLSFYSSINYFYLVKKYGSDITKTSDFLGVEGSSNNIKNERFQIIENLRLKSRIQRLKIFSLNRPKLKTDINFEILTINCSPKTFSDLLKFKKFFNNPDFRTQELLQTEMKSLFDNAYRKGVLRKKEATFKNWSNYFVVFSGGYLYFFLSPKDIKYSSYLYIKDSVVKECANEIGVQYAFKISNKFTDTFLACSSYNDLKSWVKILQKKIHEFSFRGYQISVQNNRKSENIAKVNYL